jgi:hypothetical protein
MTTRSGRLRADLESQGAQLLAVACDVADERRSSRH